MKQEELTTAKNDAGKAKADVKVVKHDAKKVAHDAGKTKEVDVKAAPVTVATDKTAKPAKVEIPAK